MKNLSIFSIMAVVIVFLSSCSTQKTIVDTSCPGYKNADFNRGEISKNHLGIMPVLGGDEKEQFRRPMGDALTKSLRRDFGKSDIRSPREVISIINDQNLTELYTKAINDYNTTGIVPKEMVIKLGEALNVRYLLYTRLLTDSEVGVISAGYSSTSIKINEIYVQCQVWDTKIGDVVWEGKGGSAKLKENNSDIIKVTARGLSGVIGNEKGKGPCEEKEELIKSAQKSASNNILAYLGITTLVSLLILAL